MNHDTVKLWINSPTVGEAFGAALLVVVVGLVCRTSILSKIYLGARIELVGYVNARHTCVH